jgi:hypothetical protein
MRCPCCDICGQGPDGASPLNKTGEVWMCDNCRVMLMDALVVADTCVLTVLLAVGIRASFSYRNGEARCLVEETDENGQA